MDMRDYHKFRKWGIWMLKMLIADDEPMALVSAAHAFSPGGSLFDAPLQSADAYETLQLLRSRRIDLCVIDIRMPGMTGLEIMEKCRNEGITTEFIVLSGYSDFTYARKAMSHGAADYCLKPVDDAEARKLLDKMGRRLAGRRKETDGAILARVSSGNTEGLAYYGVTASTPCFVVAGAENSGCPGASFFLEDRVVTLSATAPPAMEKCSVCETTPDKIPRAVAAAMNMNPEKMARGTGFTQSQYINESFLKLKSEAEERVCGDVTLAELAQKYALNYNYCSELFRKTTGKSFSELMTDKRMERASWLLVHSAVSVTGVAIEAGYSDYHYFANVFKNYFGVTPTEFRRAGGNVKP